MIEEKEESLCDNCSYETSNLKAYDQYKFCKVCYNTFLCNATIYPRQVSTQEGIWMMKSIGYIANMLLENNS